MSANKADSNIGIETYLPGGFWRRFWAFQLDALILAVLVKAVTFGVNLFLMLNLIEATQKLIASNLTQAMKTFGALFVFLLAGLISGVAFFLINQISGFLYNVIFEGAKSHATPGKKFFGLMVTGAGGRPVSLIQAFFRNLFRLLPWTAVIVAVILASGVIGSGGPEARATFVKINAFCWLGFFLILFLDYAWIAFSSDKRALHDILSGCRVVRKTPLTTGSVFLRILALFGLWVLALIAAALLGMQITITSHSRETVSPPTPVSRAVPSVRTPVPVPAPPPKISTGAPLLSDRQADIIKQVRDGLSGAVSQETVRAIKELKSVDHPQAADVLLKALKHSDKNVRAAAAWGLGGQSDPRAAEALITFLQTAADRTSLYYTLDALRVRKVRDPRITTALIDKMTSHPELSNLILPHLGKDTDPRAVQALITALNSEDGAVRFEAKIALTRGADTPVGALIEALETSSPEGRQEIVGILKIVTGQTFESDTAAWKQWWAGQTKSGDR